MRDNPWTKWMNDLILEDEESANNERDDEVGTCAICGAPIYYGDHIVGLTDRTTQILVCEDCAESKMTLTEWLDALQLSYYENEAGKVERWTLGDAHEYAKRSADVRTV